MSNELPEICYAVLNTTNEVIVIKKGQSGYYTHEMGSIKGEKNAIKLNEEIGVTIPQMKAMSSGSLFGWNVPLANPNNYDGEGNFIKKN